MQHNFLIVWSQVKIVLISMNKTGLKSYLPFSLTFQLKQRKKNFKSQRMTIITLIKQELNFAYPFLSKFLWMQFKTRLLLGTLFAVLLLRNYFTLKIGISIVRTICSKIERLTTQFFHALSLLFYSSEISLVELIQLSLFILFIKTYFSIL